MHFACSGDAADKDECRCRWKGIRLEGDGRLAATVNP